MGFLLGKSTYWSSRDQTTGISHFHRQRHQENLVGKATDLLKVNRKCDEVPLEVILKEDHEDWSGCE